MNEVLFFCYGDSTKASTWSNVPFLMAQEFEKCGIKVNRIDLSPNSPLNRIMNKLYHFLGYGANYSFIRSNLFRLISEKKIRKAIKRYPNSQFGIFLLFEFVMPTGTIPSLIFSDWTYRMLIEDRLHQIPTPQEQKFIDRQKDIIEKADIVLPLFSETYNTMKNDYPTANIEHISGNVVNIMYDGDIDAIKKDISTKAKSNYILFIGRPAYKEGLYKLIEAVSTLNDIHIEVIGMTKSDCPDSPKFCHFHGFLNKDITEENQQYYDLIKGAKVVCNPTSKWAGYSSIIECMYLWTPVIVSKFKQFTKEFGDNIDFGYYTDGGNIRQLIKHIFSLSEDDYVCMANAAHHRVKDYTWNNYVTQMIALMQSRLENGTYKN